MEGGIQWAWKPPSLSTAPTKKESLCFFGGVQSSLCWQIGWGANQSGLQRDKDGGEGCGRRGGEWWRRMTCQMRKKTYWMGQSWRTEKNILNRLRKCNLLTIWISGWKQSPSVFLELYKTPNYSVREIKGSQGAVKWEKKRAVIPMDYEWWWKFPSSCLKRHHFISTIIII